MSDATPESVPSSPKRKIVGAIYSSLDFLYDKQKRQFTSTYFLVPGVLRDLWQDRFELGFGMRSVKTGKVVEFVLLFANKDEDGRYAEWVFESVNVEPPILAVVLNDT